MCTVHFYISICILTNKTSLSYCFHVPLDRLRTASHFPLICLYVSVYAIAVLVIVVEFILNIVMFGFFYEISTFYQEKHKSLFA